MTREKFPEKIPFRLTRMLTNAMEVNIPSLIRRELFLGKMAPMSNVFFSCITVMVEPLHSCRKERCMLLFQLHF